MFFINIDNYWFCKVKSITVKLVHLLDIYSTTLYFNKLGEQGKRGIFALKLKNVT